MSMYMVVNIVRGKNLKFLNTWRKKLLKVEGTYHLKPLNVLCFDDFCVGEGEGNEK